MGTATNVQMMVYGNIADGVSGTGVAFTRNPATGEKKFTVSTRSTRRVKMSFRRARPPRCRAWLTIRA